MGMYVAGIVYDIDEKKVYFNIAGYVDEGGGKIRVAELTNTVESTLKTEEVLNLMVEAEINRTIPPMIPMPRIETGQVVNEDEWGNYINNVIKWFEEEVPKHRQLIGGLFEKIIPES